MEQSLKFRSEVLEEFERLVRDGLPVAGLPEVEETELAPLVETVAFAQTSPKEPEAVTEGLGVHAASFVAG